MGCRTIAALAVVISFTGCASDVANRYYGAESYPPRMRSEVQILYSRPAQAFTVIADFQSRGEDAEDLRKKAAAIGADAVIVSYLGGHHRLGTQWASEDPSTTYTRIAGTAIKFTK